MNPQQPSPFSIRKLSVELNEICDNLSIETDETRQLDDVLQGHYPMNHSASFLVLVI